MDELIKFKDDFQQRSWAVHEDKSVIGKCLEDVLSILVSSMYPCGSIITVTHEVEIRCYNRCNF